jgi:nucleolin
MNQSIFQGRRIAVQFHRRREPINLTQPKRYNEPSKTLFIGNMSFEMSDKDLNDLFREVRNVVDVRVAIDRRTGAPRGFAHADFIDVESAMKAREYLKDKEIYGRKLRVDYSMSSTGPKP